MFTRSWGKGPGSHPVLSPKDAARNPCASCVNHPKKMHVVDHSCENHTCCCLSKIFQTISDDIIIYTCIYIYIYIYIVYRVCLSIGYPKNQWSIMIFPIQWPCFIVNIHHVQIQIISNHHIPMGPWISSWFGFENSHGFIHFYPWISDDFHHEDHQTLGPLSKHPPWHHILGGEIDLGPFRGLGLLRQGRVVNLPGNDGKMPGKHMGNRCQIISWIIYHFNI